LVSIERFKISNDFGKHDYYLMVNALVPYKRTDVVIEAFRSLNQQKLIIVGQGPEHSKLQLLASSNVKILGNVTDERLEELYSNCKALIYPALEDFGIAPVEAQAAGRPVICLDRGGCSETVILSGEKVTGIKIEDLSPSGIVEVINKFEPLLQKGYFEPEFCRESALRFSEQAFIKNITRSMTKN
jgi:glycosyltransferase involved in cell wall biosynthesis